MRFALVSNQRQEATPKTKGICPACDKLVIAKCGERKQWHWAHKIVLGCKNDRWENEGQWHRNWKNQFPKEWQERPRNFNNEKHIADIETPQGLVIEIQHSNIELEEKESREKAYNKMIWLVDGTSSIGAFALFKKNINIENKNLVYEIEKEQRIYVIHPRESFNSSKPIVFDFLGEREEKNATDIEKYLYFVLPTNKKSKIQNDFLEFIFRMPRKDFVPMIMNDKWEDLYFRVLCHIDAYIEREKIIKQKTVNNNEKPYVYEEENSNKRRKRYFGRYNK